MKFIDLSQQEQLDVLDRVSTELNIRQRLISFLQSKLLTNGGQTMRVCAVI